MSDTLSFLAALHTTVPAGEWLELRGIDPRGEREPTRAWYQATLPLFRQALAWSEAGRNVYVSIHPRTGKQSGDGAVTRMAVLPADIDSKLWGGDVGDLEQAVSAFALPPSLAVWSGGGMQVYWLLDAPLVDQPTYRVLAHRLARALCGPGREPDHIATPERLLRLPGTLNHKYTPPRPVRLLWDDGPRHDPAAIAAWLAEHAAWTAPPAPSLPRLSRALPGVIADFNARYDLGALLVAHGAVELRRSRACRQFAKPGQRTVSATLDYHPGVLILHAEHFLRLAKAEARGYDAFAVYAALEHHGDRAAAYQAAKAAAYGMRSGLRIDGQRPQEAVRALAGGIR